MNDEFSNTLPVGGKFKTTKTAQEAWSKTIATLQSIIECIDEQINIAIEHHKMYLNFYWNQYDKCIDMNEHDVRTCIYNYYVAQGYKVYISTYLNENKMLIEWSKY